MLTADRSKQVALRDKRNDRDTQSKMLHIYMLCSHPDVQVHARAVAISPTSASTHQQLQELEYDLTVIESVLSILLGTIMSLEGEKATRPIAFKPEAIRWAHQVRRQIDDLPPPVGYGASGALPCSQFSAWDEMPSFTKSLHKILKTVFDGCGIIIEWTNGSFKYDEDFVWYPTDCFSSVWSLVWTWLVALTDEDVPDMSAIKNVREAWLPDASTGESFETLTLPPELDNQVSACIAWSVPGTVVRQLRAHVESYLITHLFFVVDS